MKIVIAGAGDVGLHLSKLLAKEGLDISLIDIDEEVLEYAQSHVDVMTVRGTCTSMTVLREAGIEDARLLLAVSTNENDNIIACILAKKMGCKYTIARISSTEYLDPVQKGIFLDLGVDKVISPNIFAAQEISRLLELCEVTDNFEFEEGKIKLIGVTIEDESNIIGKTIAEVDNELENIRFRAIAILRGNHTILPRGGTVFRRSDHVYFLASETNVELVLKKMGRELRKIKNVMIIGGGSLTMNTAELIQEKYNITIVEKSKELCRKLIDRLENVLVVNADPSNIEYLKEEGLQDMDAFIALTPNSETNIVSSLMAEHNGVFKTIALVDNVDYTRISQDIGVDTLINKKLIAANNIFRHVRKGNIEAITSLHGVDAEIIEYIITRESKITKKPLRDLNFPQDALIGGVVRNGAGVIPTGDFQMRVGDKAIVFSMHASISEVERFFQ